MFVVAIVSCPIALVFASLLWYLSCTDINCFYTLNIYTYIIQPRHDIILHTTLFLLYILYHYILCMYTCIKNMYIAICLPSKVTYFYCSLITN